MKFTQPFTIAVLPEEVPPFRLLEDVGDDPREEPRAVQNLNLLLLRPTR